MSIPVLQSGSYQLLQLSPTDAFAACINEPRNTFTITVACFIVEYYNIEWWKLIKNDTQPYIVNELYCRANNEKKLIINSWCGLYTYNNIDDLSICFTAYTIYNGLKSSNYDSYTKKWMTKVNSTNAQDIISEYLLDNSEPSKKPLVPISEILSTIKIETTQILIDCLLCSKLVDKLVKHRVHVNYVPSQCLIVEEIIKKRIINLFCLVCRSCTDDEKILYAGKCIQYSFIEGLNILKDKLNGEHLEYMCMNADRCMIVEYAGMLTDKKYISLLLAESRISETEVVLSKLKINKDIYQKYSSYTYHDIITKQELLLYASYIESDPEREKFINSIGVTLPYELMLDLLKKENFRCFNRLHNAGRLDGVINVWKEDVVDSVLLHLLELDIYPTHKFIHDYSKDTEPWIKLLEKLNIESYNRCMRCHKQLTMHTDRCYEKFMEIETLYGKYTYILRAICGKSFECIPHKYDDENLIKVSLNVRSIVYYCQEDNNEYLELFASITFTEFVQKVKSVYINCKFTDICLLYSFFICFGEAAKTTNIGKIQKSSTNIMDLFILIKNNNIIGLKRMLLFGCGELIDILNSVVDQNIESVFDYRLLIRILECDTNVYKPSTNFLSIYVVLFAKIPNFYATKLTNLLIERGYIDLPELVSVCIRDDNDKLFSAIFKKVCVDDELILRLYRSKAVKIMQLCLR